MNTRIQSERTVIAGPVGGIEVLAERPDHAPRALALIGHPHPLFGGTMENKVVVTVARALREKPAEIQPLAEARAAFERDYLISLLKLTRGQVSEVARLAGRNRTEVYRLLQRHGLTPALFKDRDDAP